MTSFGCYSIPKKFVWLTDGKGLVVKWTVDVIKKWQPLNEYGYSFILLLILLFMDSLIELFTELFIDLSID